MNRFARTGEIADPCGVPLSRSTRVPSGCCSGAASHRLTYSSTQRQSVTAFTARTTRSQGTVSKNFWTSKIDRPSRTSSTAAGIPRARHGPTSSADSHRSPGGTEVPPAAPDTWPPPSARSCPRSSARRALGPRAVRLGDLHRPDRRRKVGPRTHPVGSPGGIAPPGSHRSRRDSLPSPGSSHPVIQAMVVHCQWLRRVGSRVTTPFHHAMARLNARSRLYFLRAHRRM